jgi:hypothetical protein
MAELPPDVYSEDEQRKIEELLNEKNELLDAKRRALENGEKTKAAQLAEIGDLTQKLRKFRDDFEKKVRSFPE